MLPAWREHGCESKLYTREGVTTTMSVSIRILACVSTICNPDDRPEKREAQLASALKRAYNEQFENYIARNVSTITWGVDKPEHITRAAKAWNSDIIHDLMMAIGGVLSGPSDGALPILNSDRTQELTIAAAAANDEARPDAKCLLFNLPAGGSDTSWYYECVLSENRLNDALKHPENYAIVWLYAD